MNKLNDGEKIIYYGYCWRNGDGGDGFTVVVSESLDKALIETKADREHLTRLERKNCEHMVWGYKVSKDFDPDDPDCDDSFLEGDPEECYDNILTDEEIAEAEDRRGGNYE